MVGHYPINEEGEDILISPQPETQSISPEQLTRELKGMYTGILMADAKCMSILVPLASLTESGRLALSSIVFSYKIL